MITGFWKISLPVITTGLVTTFLVSNLVLNSSALASHDDNVTICHKNNGSGWSRITVDDDAVNGFGGGDHNTSQHQGGQDIIPPGYWDANGRNWDTTGQAIWNNNCNVLTPSPSPSVSPSPSPSPSVSPSPSPSPSVSPSPSPSPSPDPSPSPS